MTNLFLPSLDGFDRELALPATAQWKPRPDRTLTAPADSRLLARDLFTAQPSRTGNRYPRQKNYHGFYWHTSSGTQLWHESLNERDTFMWLDFSQDIVAIAAQPVHLTFADGTEHFPDIIALHADQRQVLYDVKPKRGITDAFILQTQKTQAVCDHIGWSYEVHRELPARVLAGLQWLALFRHPRFHPGQDTVDALLAQVTGPMPLNEVARLLPLPTLGNGRAAVYHLLWERVLTVNLTLPLTNTALLRKAPDAHA